MQNMFHCWRHKRCSKQGAYVRPRFSEKCDVRNLTVCQAQFNVNCHKKSNRLCGNVHSTTAPGKPHFGRGPGWSSPASWQQPYRPHGRSNLHPSAHWKSIDKYNFKQWMKHFASQETFTVWLLKLVFRHRWRNQETARALPPTFKFRIFQNKFK